MLRIWIGVFLIFSVGCSSSPQTDAVVGESNPGVVDGGGVENADRDKVQEYFDRLANVQSVEAEEKLLKEFAEWLRKNEYSIRVDLKNGKHDLSCPYFPPVTPYTEHSFLDVKNLELLPRLEE